MEIRVTMSEQHATKVNYVIGPDGSPLTIADLPPPDPKRRVIRRKAEVVAPVRGGLISPYQPCLHYTFTVGSSPPRLGRVHAHGPARPPAPRVPPPRL